MVNVKDFLIVINVFSYNLANTNCTIIVMFEKMNNNPQMTWSTFQN